MRIKLSTKFSFFVTLLIVCAATILGVFFFRLQKQVMFKEIKERGMTIISTVADDSEYALLTGSIEELGTIAEGVLRLDDVIICSIREINHDFEVSRSLDDSYEELLKETYNVAVLGEVKTAVEVFTTDELLIISAPVRSIVEEEVSGEAGLFAFDEMVEDKDKKDNVIGIVKIGFSLFRLQEMFSKTLFTIIVIALAIALFSSIVAMLLVRVAVIPIRKLVEGTHVLAQGNLGVRIDSKSNDEIGELASSFNLMAEALQDSRMNLVESREYSNSIVESMLDALFVIDAAGNIELLNPTALKLLGYSYEELLGYPLSNVFTRRKDLLLLMEEVQKKQKVNEVEVEFIDKNGDEIPVSISISLMKEKPDEDVLILPDEMKKENNFIIVVRDMRRIKILIDDINSNKEKLEEWSKTLEQRVDERTKELLRSQETMLNIMTDLEESKTYVENVLANLMDSVVVLGMDGVIRSVNNVTVKMLNYSQENLIGKNFISLIDDFGVVDLIRNQGQVRNIETVYKTVDDQDIPILLSGAVMKDKQENGTGIVVISKDITEQKKVDAELRTYLKQVEEINKELDDFTYIVSHDLKEPLRSIDAFSKFIAEDYTENLDEEGLMYVERVRSNALRMQKLIEDLLEVSRLERRRNPFSEVKVRDLIDDALLRLEYSIMEKKVVVNVAEGFPTISCDRHRLGEVIYNLLSNAIKFLDKEESVIHVGYSDVGNEYEFYVKDNGIGIEEQYFNKIFKIFQRLGKREDYAGTGAGLTIVKKIVEMHGGRIWVESEAGSWTKFIFTIPKISEPDEPGFKEK